MNVRGLHAAGRVALLGVVAPLLGIGCMTVPDKDYTAFRANMPRSILVLPPLNESVDAGASRSYLTVASEAIGERGYYVYPVAVVDAFMRNNGLPDPADMHAVPLEKIDEIIGADAVLYIALEEFGQKFELLNSTTRVRARARLVDVKSGQELWSDDVDHAVGSAGAGGGLLGSVLSAAVTQVANVIDDRVHDAARVANAQLVAGPRNGFLYGPRHPRFGTEELPGTGALPGGTEAVPDEANGTVGEPVTEPSSVPSTIDAPS